MYCSWINCSHSNTLLLAWSLEPENSTTSHLWCGNFTGYQSGKGSSLRQPFWSSRAFMDWLRHIWALQVDDRPFTSAISQRDRACCLFRAHGQPTATGVLPSVDQSRGTIYLWHCDQVTSRRRLSEDSWRHFCLTVLTSYVDSYRDRQLRNHTAISADIAYLWPLRTCAI